MRKLIIIIYLLNVLWQLSALDTDNKQNDKISVTFFVSPADAVIKVNGIDFLSGEAQLIPIGNNNVHIEKSGYKTIDKVIEVSGTQSRFYYFLEEIKPVQVMLRSDPAGADIYINQVKVGITNKQVQFYPSNNKIKLVKAGYQELTDSLNISETSPNQYLWKLIKNTAQVDLLVFPPNAKVYLNKEEVKDFKVLNLVPGTYSLEVKASHYYDKSETIFVKLGEDLKLNIALKPKVGTIQISCSPNIATIDLKQGNKTLKTFSNAVYLNDLLEGEYQVVLRAEGYISQTQTIQVSENTPCIAVIDLVKGIDTKEVKTNTNPVSYVSVTNGILPEMVFVQGGSYKNNKTEITVSSFYLGKYEVTQAEYEEIMGVNPSKFQESPDNPVERVSWFDAIVYCNRRSIKENLVPCYSYLNSGTNQETWPAGWNLNDNNHNKIICLWTADGYRLPTEAEWEFAAREGTKSRGFSYSGNEAVDQVAWYNKNSGNKTHSVGSKKPNGLNIFDLSGNVWEWCWDIYGVIPNGLQTNPNGASKGIYRTIKGGGYSGDDSFANVTDRDGCYAATKYGSLGFRVARKVLAGD